MIDDYIAISETKKSELTGLDMQYIKKLKRLKGSLGNIFSVQRKGLPVKPQDDLSSPDAQKKPIHHKAEPDYEIGSFIK
jgi:hypothetical protein